MSKRFFPQQNGDRKKPRLDLSFTDQDIPLSQNKEPDQASIWGDDDDDEILLQVSQACEDAYNANDVSLLPDYTMCMEPPSTSTQMSFPAPSTSKDFTFKKPSTNPPSAISINLREKCSRISSPLPGITTNIMPKANEPNLSDDYMFNDKVYNGQDSTYTYRQLLQLQAENAKLKSENCKMLEKCVTKEGEASILRTQLKMCQVSVDNARLDKIKAQEKVQMEWTEKLAAANNQMQELRTQLDFKNLEIISVKEKCKKLESSKVNLTQVTVANKDFSQSYRPNSSVDSTAHRKVKTSSSAIQTDNKADFITLNITYRKATSHLPSLSLHLLQPTTPSHSLLDHNEKLAHKDVPHECSEVFSTLHRSGALVKKKGKIQLAAVYEDVVRIANGVGDREIYFNVFDAAKNILTDVINRLETISRRMTTAFQREMDNKYLDMTYSFIDVRREDLLKGMPLYKEEQEILARRITGIMSYIVEAPSGADYFKCYEQSTDSKEHFTDCVYRICTLLDTTSTTALHSGLLLSLSHTLLATRTSKTLSIIRSMVSSRPAAAVSCRLVELVREVSLWENFREQFCRGTAEGNLKMDYEHGVLLYSKDSCHLQILLKQVEVSLKCIEDQELAERAAETTRQLVILYCNLDYDTSSLLIDKSRCNCQLLFLQIIVYALRICAVMLRNSSYKCNEAGWSDLLALCRCGVRLVWARWAREETGAPLAGCEGHLLQFCEILREYTHHEIYVNMLSELAGSFQSRLEDAPSPIYKEPWLKSFEAFTVSD